ncbi:MAG: hypothetical protein J0H49_31535 [Acidobacteria bacterium]|nr:hypothetical protein [Acidobacteriota bacterium]
MSANDVTHPKTKFVEADNTQRGEWFDHRETFFWHDRTPHEVKFEIEKLTGTLLARDATQAERLTYVGDSSSGGTRRVLRLRFEAVTPRRPYMFEPWTDPREYRNQFSLRVEMATPRKWVTGEAFQRNLDRAFEHWTLRLLCGPGGNDWVDRLKPLYDRQVAESLAREAMEAQKKEDPRAIADLQLAVLESLRAGMRFSAAHKEGGTILSFNGQTFLRSDYGEEPGLRIYATDAEMLQAIRDFYDWESRRDCYPHRPPELEVWRYIRQQLR